MKKENTIINLIISMATFVFTETEFSKFLSYIKLKLFNRMRVFIEDKLERLETLLLIHKDSTEIEARLNECRKLDSVVTDLCVNNIQI